MQEGGGIAGRAYRNLDVLRRIADLQTLPKPLAAARALLAEVDSFGSRVLGVGRSRALELTASIHSNESTAPEEIAAALERDDWFENVTPGKREAARFLLTARVCAGDVPTACPASKN